MHSFRLDFARKEGLQIKSGNSAAGEQLKAPTLICKTFGNQKKKKRTSDPEKNKKLAVSLRANLNPQQ